jgi:predicted Zn-dependent peptidase
MYQEHTLANGLKILMVPVQNIQSISVGVFVKIGSRFERPAEAGLSHFIEHMLFKGNTALPSARLIAEAIEGIGGLSNAYTGQDTTVYYAKVAAAHTRTAIEFLANLVRNPLFDPAEFEKERFVIGEEINMVYDAPDSWVNVLVDELMWPDHPLGQSILGGHESLAGITHPAMVSFFKAAYHPQNMLIAVAGAFEVADLIAELDARLGDWEPGRPPLFEPAPGLQTAARCHVEPRPIEQGHLCLALPALSRLDPDRHALSVLNTILGDGMSSRLFLNIREERGLAYAVDSGLNFLQDIGSLLIYAGVDPDRAPEALQAILAELARLRDEPVPPAELRKAKEYLKGRLVLGLEDSYSRAAWVAYQALFLDRIRSPEEILEIYDAITAADVQTVAQRLLRPSAYNLAAVGPFEQADDLSRLLWNAAS